MLGDKLAVYDLSPTFYGFGIDSGRMYAKASSVEVFTLDANGFMGIGLAASPARRLEIRVIPAGWFLSPPVVLRFYGVVSVAGSTAIFGMIARAGTSKHCGH
jgi:hypothetical protein